MVLCLPDTTCMPLIAIHLSALDFPSSLLSSYSSLSFNSSSVIFDVPMLNTDFASVLAEATKVCPEPFAGYENTGP
jgi:hypothetical protein